MNIMMGFEVGGLSEVCIDQNSMILYIGVYQELVGIGMIVMTISMEYFSISILPIGFTAQLRTV